MGDRTLVCTGCGAEAEAACDCHVGYEPKSVRAAKYAEQNPTASVRQIAKETGVSIGTAYQAKAGVQSLNTSDTTTGLDGKSYPAKTEHKPFIPEPHAADCDCWVCRDEREKEKPRPARKRRSRLQRWLATFDIRIWQAASTIELALTELANDGEPQDVPSRRSMRRRSTITSPSSNRRGPR
jgi:hypothetical protein